MKALLSRLNRGLTGKKDTDGQAGSSSGNNPKHKSLQLPPLPDWPPQQQQQLQSPVSPPSHRAQSPNPRASQHKPLPELSHQPSTTTTTATSNTPNTTAPPSTDDSHDTTASNDSTTAQLDISAPPPPSLLRRSSLNTKPSPPQPTSSPPPRDSTVRSTSTAGVSRIASQGTTKSRATGDEAKKVAFRSPPPSPGPDQALNTSGNQPHGFSALGRQENASTVSLKTPASRFAAQHHPSEVRGSTSTGGASSSRTALVSGSHGRAGGSAVRLPGPNSRGAPSPYPNSVRSGTPYSAAGSTTGLPSEILSVTSWSEAAEDDLVSNLGPRERTRQEVLWEIVASEERYVLELQKMKDTFLDPLLHPYYTPNSPSNHGHGGAGGTYDYLDEPLRSDSPLESHDHLPIAARFASSPSQGSGAPGGMMGMQPSRSHTPHITGESSSDEEGEGEDVMGRLGPPTTSGAHKGRSPYRASTQAPPKNRAGGPGAVAFPSRSHQSLPPPPRGTQGPNGSTASLGRATFAADKQAQTPNNTASKGSAAGLGLLRKLKKSGPSASERDAAIYGGSHSGNGSAGQGGGVAPGVLPEDLRKCLGVIEGAVIEGHNALSKGLRKRYDEQYPLVRSLADVFVAHSHILHGYATYVLHLERALEEVDAALSTAAQSKKPKKSNADDWSKLCLQLQRLEAVAAERGETGLAISLSKPFQRLLKYPLLFQNLLYHTDPSTFEYESTLQMVAEVETIVRSIEDEKIQKEERDRTRDVFARIEGLAQVRQLALPKPSRLLVEERPLLGVTTPPGSGAPSPPPTGQNGKAVKGKTSFKRLSDVLGGGGGTGGIGGKKDVWLVVFNDVVLRCQRTGQTSLPIAAATNTRTNSMPDMQGRSKYATTGRRHSQTKPRNLYKFIKIETWAIQDVVQPRNGVVAMEDVARTRQAMATGNQPRIVPMPDDDDEEDSRDRGGSDSDNSDSKSKMSFSYWGADKVTLQKPVVKPAARGTPSSSTTALGGSGAGNGSGGPHAGGGGRTKSGATPPTPAYGRESSANAKFGTRLVSDAPVPAPRATTSRRAATNTPTARRPGAHSEDGHGHGQMASTTTRSASTRPPWNGSSRGPPSGGGPGASNSNTTTTTPTNAARRVRNTSQPSAPVRATTTPVSPPNKPILGSPAPSEDSGVGLYRQIMSKDPSLKEL